MLTVSLATTLRREGAMWGLAQQLLTRPASRAALRQRRRWRCNLESASNAITSASPPRPSWALGAPPLVTLCVDLLHNDPCTAGATWVRFVVGAWCAHSSTRCGVGRYHGCFSVWGFALSMDTRSRQLAPCSVFCTRWVLDNFTFGQIIPWKTKVRHITKYSSREGFLFVRHRRLSPSQSVTRLRRRPRRRPARSSS